MPELRQDLIRDAWVVIAKDRALKPNDFPINKNEMHFKDTNHLCPFCVGNEEHTPPEITAYREIKSLPNTPGWTVRTIPNKYSAFSLQRESNEEYDGINNSCSGIGQHEVVIETPEHGLELHEFDMERINLVYKMLRERYISLAEDGRIKYIQIYKNRGIFAGASLEHSHSQIIALPMVPEVNKGVSRYYSRNGTCLLCDILQQEQTSKERVVYQGKEFIVICPYASRFAYEVWIIPIQHVQHFGDINDIQLEELVYIIKNILKTIIATLDNPSYNIVINSAPVNMGSEDGYHWFIEVVPRLIVMAGVEIATGIYMNPVAPEIATSLFREYLK
ncbi:MAG TPA: DUF4931 domain-containing protein [Syntrophomonadaceae bacterium]|nr:DUF4931 domain-containing protein [Syntrophomonadaceae bacterium]